MSIFTKLGQAIFAGYNAMGLPRSIVTSEAQTWATEVERIIDVAVSGGGFLLYTTKALLDADLAHGANTAAMVLGDSLTNDGIYSKVGASGAGSWTKVAEPFESGFVKATDDGGTANAILATTSMIANETKFIALPITLTNTTNAVTVAFNGGSILDVKSSSGNNPLIGSLIAGTVLGGYISGSNFFLLSDLASLAIQAAAEAALDEFTDIYLGSKASDPALDNDGDALQTGAMYFNETFDELRIYNGSSWVNAGSSSTAASVSVSDTAEFFSAVNVEDVLAEIGPPRGVSILKYGAKADGVQKSDGAIDVGVSTTTLTSAGSNFTGRAGQFVTIAGAGVAGALLVSTIASVTSPTVVEIADAASTTVSGATIDYGTVNTVPFKDAIDASREVWAPAGVFYIGNVEHLNVAGLTFTGQSKFKFEMRVIPGTTGNIWGHDNPSGGTTGLHDFSNFYLNLNGADVTGFNMDSVGTTDIHDFRILGGPNLAGAVGIGVHFNGNSLHSGSYSNTVRDHSINSCARGIWFDEGGNHNVVIGGEIITCINGVDTVPNDIVLGASDGAIDTGVSATTLTSATAAFDADDVGSRIAIDGAGTAGARHVTTIASFTSGTEVELTDAAITTVSGAVYTYVNGSALKTVDTPRVFGTRIEGCTNGILDGASYGMYYGIRFEASVATDINFQISSDHPFFSGGFTASSGAVLTALERADSPVIHSSDLGWYEIEESASRPKRLQGKHVFTSAGSDRSPTVPSGVWAAYFNDPVYLRNDVLLKTGGGSPEGSVTAEIGSNYHQTDGGPAQWIKESGSGNTGWGRIPSVRPEVTFTATANGQTFTPTAEDSHYKIVGNSAHRTGTIIATTNAWDGQPIELHGDSWGVAFIASSTIDTTAGISLGSSATQMTGCRLKYSASAGKWQIVGFGEVN